MRIRETSTPGWCCDVHIELLVGRALVHAVMICRPARSGAHLPGNRGMTDITIQDGKSNGCHASWLRLMMQDGLQTGDARRAQEREWVDMAHQQQIEVLGINQGWICSGRVEPLPK